MNFSLVRTVTADTEYLYFHLFFSEACSHEGKGVLKRLNDEVRCAMRCMAKEILFLIQRWASAVICRLFLNGI